MARLQPIVAVVCGVAFSIPASAMAHAHRTPLSIALEHAYQLWGVKPCGGHYRVEVATLPEWAGGYSTWETPTGPNVYTSPPATWSNCVMQLPAEHWTAEQVQVEWVADCTAVLHEWGHLTGHPHSDEAGAPPEPAGMTREQLAVMRSGEGSDSDDLSRCHWRP